MIVYRLFTAGEYDKREQWLNEMCKKGYALKNFNFIKYEFQQCEPGQYYYCVELIENLTCNPNHDDYINFLRDEWGVDYVASNNNWVVFKRDSIRGKFSLFSNKISKIAYFKRILSFRMFLIFLLLLIGTMNILSSPFGYEHTTFSVLGILIATFIFIGNIPTLIKLHKLKKQTSPS